MMNAQTIQVEVALLAQWVKKHKGAPLCQKAMDWREALGWVLGTEGPLSERLARYNAYYDGQDGADSVEGTADGVPGGSEDETGGSDGKHYLMVEADSPLGRLWDNEDDAIFDTM
jgi:hypothetical protein